jgi:CubicO group peptidase (beta-lactamase class C family)
MNQIKDLTAFPELRSRVIKGMKTFQVPGLALGIIQDGQWFAEGFGVTSIANPLPVTSDTTFQIGSTSKTVTATVIMMLVEEGKLELDEPVKTYLPNLELSDADVAARVTVRHLLNHTAGWAGDLFVHTGDGDDALGLYVQKMRDLPQLTPLGEVWHYNNAAFGLAGRVVEAVTGKTFESVATELVLDPLEMTHSSYFPSEAMLERFAVGHFVNEHDVVQISKPWALARNTSSVGRINSSVIDQLKYAQFHLGDGTTSSGKRLLSSEAMIEMQTPTVNGANGAMHAISWFVHDLAGTKLVRHGGATNGQMSEFYLVPERNFAWTILTNAEKGRALNTEMVGFIHQHLLGLQASEPEHLNLSASELEPFLGSYRDSNFGTTIEFKLEGEHLILHVTLGDRSGVSSIVTPPPPDAKCTFIAGDRVLVLEGDSKGGKLEILRDPSGRVRYLRSGGRLYFKV